MNRLAAALKRAFARIHPIQLRHAVPLLLAWAVCFVGAADAKEYTAAPPQKDAPPLAQRFPEIDKAKYAAPAWSGKVARDIADKKHSMRTRARAALKYARENADGVNFAGRYIVFSYGCGTGCISFNVIEAASGKIFSGIGPITSYYLEDGVVDRDLHYEKGSRLLYVQGSVDEGPGGVSGSGSFAFAFKDGKFRLLRHSPVVGTEVEY